MPIVGLVGLRVLLGAGQWALKKLGRAPKKSAMEEAAEQFTKFQVRAFCWARTPGPLPPEKGAAEALFVSSAAAPAHTPTLPPPRSGQGVQRRPRGAAYTTILGLSPNPQPNPKLRLSALRSRRAQGKEYNVDPESPPASAGSKKGGAAKDGAATNAKLGAPPAKRLTTGVTYKDVAGIDNILEDIEECMRMLLGDEEYTAAGARPPRVSHPPAQWITEGMPYLPPCAPAGGEPAACWRHS